MGGSEGNYEKSGSVPLSRKMEVIRRNTSPWGGAAIGLGEGSRGLLMANLWQENSSTLFVKVKVQKFLRKAYTYLAEY